ncbi:MAG: sulfatase [Opitutales bacterium]|jgi:arylsulfatase A-like enzyme|nr:sulfatase [Opitutales bacterium]
MNNPTCICHFERLVAFTSFIIAIVLVHAEAAKPNVILIFADDLGYGDVGTFYPDSPFETPRLDRMAAEGAKLTHFYVPTPYCAPSRGTILTGRYPFRHTVVRNPAPDAGQNNIGLPSSEITIAEILKDRGYNTAMYGKWHLGHKEQWLPRTQGFDEYQGILYSNDMFPVQMVKDETVIQYPVDQGKLSQLYTDLTLDFAKRNKDHPFFVYLPHAMPHKPLAVTDDFYTPGTPDNLYADAIAELDYSVGRLLDGLKDLGIAENTLVLFTSDNGPFYGGSTGGLRGMKGKTWEGGLRVPMIAYMPGTIPAGTVNNHPAATVDILPTVSKLTSSSVPTDRTIDGRNILPMLTDGSTESPHEAIFGMQGRELAIIRSGKWKLHVRSPGPVNMINLPLDEARKRVNRRAPDGVTIIAPFEQPDPSEYPGILGGVEPSSMLLFDMEEDSAEQVNVANDHPKVVTRLKKLFDKTKAEMKDVPAPESEYLFGQENQSKGVLMRLIGGELRYDHVPKPQEHLIEK